ncbi:prepilin peptidase [Celerinatantimonas yamalensis]|uniref:Prepilin leader peptidase/N-methyltransferase n=1 Tax=Celerinatantimonas yamalensis TaxID=559956 RepID=A0ABW9G559_9GAMM
MAHLTILWQQFPILFLILSSVLALVIGSFLNVVIYRLPLMLKRQWRADCQQFLGELEDEPALPEGIFNLSLPRSSCPHCQHKIAFWQNVPLISWLLLRGHCHYCKHPISWRYPLVELLSLLLVMLAFLQFSLTGKWLFACLFSLTLLTLAVIDLRTMLLPDQLTLPLLWIGLLVNSHHLFVSLHQAIWGAALGYLCLWSLYWGFKLLTGKEGMGYGDFKLLAAIGAWLGWASLPMVLLLSSASGALFGIWLLILRRSKRQTPLPFGPFLTLGALCYLLYGPTLSYSYGLLIGG